MDSRLEPLFRTTFRQTEKTDTWQGIRHEEPKDDRRKREQKEKSENAVDLWEDNTIVSIGALKAFLQGLLSTSSEPGREPPPVSPSPPPEALPSSQAAQAAKAYGHAHSVAHKTQTPSPSAAPPAPKNSVSLSVEEERAIHRLIADVAFLESHHVENLLIRRSESFLQSLIDAAALARTALSG